MPRLREHGRFVAYASILDSPEADTIRGIRNALPSINEPAPTEHILHEVERYVLPLGQPFVLIVDQVERCFGLAPNKQEHLEFWRSVATLIHGNLRRPTSVILAVRSDWLYAFQDVGPSFAGIPIFSFLYRLEPLTSEAAGVALRAPLELFGVTCEPGVIEEIVNDLRYDRDYVHPPQLQIVGDALYRHMLTARNQDSNQLTLADYQQLGGAHTIIRQHLLRIVEGLGPNGQACWQLLIRLAGAGDIRVSRPAADLSGNLPPDQFALIMDHLVNNALVIREFSNADASSVYTLTHDYLLEEINSYIAQNHQVQAWRTAEHYLNAGLSDWENARQRNGAELLLDRERYQYIWANRSLFEGLDETGSDFLTRTALSHGSESCGYWLSRLTALNPRRGWEIIERYCFHKDEQTRLVACHAVIKAQRSHLLSPAVQHQLAQLLVHIFRSPASIEPQPSGDQAPRKGSVASSIAPAAQRREAAARLLWPVRHELTWRDRAGVTAATFLLWLRAHRGTLAASMASALVAGLFMLGVFVVGQSLRGVWRAMPPLYAGPVEDMALTGDATYVVTARGSGLAEGASLLRGVTNSDEWQLLSRNLTTQPVNGLTVVDAPGRTRIYLSVEGKGVLRSDDLGKTWLLINAGLASYALGRVTPDPENPERLYVGSKDQHGVFASDDGGDSWRDISGQTLLGASITSMIFTRSKDGLLLAATTDARVVGRSAGDADWRPLWSYPTSGAVQVLNVDFVTNQVIYAGTQRGHLWASFDGGASWIERTSPPNSFQINSITTLPGFSNVLFVNSFGVGGNSTWKSYDYGERWESVGDADFTRDRLSLAFSAHHPSVLYAAGLPGLLESGDAGNHWDIASLGAPLAAIHKIAISPFANGPVYIAVGSSIYSDLGNEAGEWQRGHGLIGVVVRKVTPDLAQRDRAYAAVYLPNRWSVFVTQDGGRTWAPTAAPTTIPERFLNDASALAQAQTPLGAAIYAGFYGCGILYSPDGGVNWETGGRHNCELPKEAPKSVIDIAIAPLGTDTVYAVGDSTWSYRSHDRALTWEATPLPLTHEILDLDVDPMIQGRLYLVAGADGFWRSDDDGHTWRPYATGLAGKSLVHIATVPTSAESLYIAAATGEVWWTRDGGEHWQLVSENLPSSAVGAISFHPQRGELVIGSLQGGLFRYSPGSIAKLWQVQGE